MSICGDCPYPYEAILAEDAETREEACGNSCLFEDAAYRAQWAYNQLYERYKDKEEERNDK